MTNRIIIAITGASGSIYGIRLLEILKKMNIETHLILSKNAALVISEETDFKMQNILSLASFVHNYQNVGACISSGSFRVDGMVIAPCSMKTLASVANSFEDNLITRSASVILKERKKLVALTREFPLNLAHIRNMEKVTEMGGIIAPPCPAFYNRPQNIDDIINHTIYRTLDLLGIESSDLKRWEGIGKENNIKDDDK